MCYQWRIYSTTDQASKSFKQGIKEREIKKEKRLVQGLNLYSLCTSGNVALQCKHVVEKPKALRMLRYLLAFFSIKAKRKMASVSANVAPKFE